MSKIIQKRNTKDHREKIIRSFHQGTSVEEIAKDENVSSVTIYKYLLMWRVREKREKVSSEGDVERRKSTTILPFGERISPEILNKLTFNSIINKKFIKYYKLKDDVWFATK